MKKKIIVILAIVAVVVVALIAIFINIQGQQNNTSNFVGTWRNLEHNSTENLWTFYNNGTFKAVANYLDENLSNAGWGTYWVDNNKLYLKSIYNGQETTVFYEYEFSNNDARLTLTFTYMGTTIVFDKI